jgi:hypothetical protein
MKAWFDKTIGSPGELEYGEMLAWYGLRFAGGVDTTWTLEVRPNATSAQKRRLKALLTSSGPPRSPDERRPPRPVMGRLLERVGELQDAPLIPMAADNLQADR